MRATQTAILFDDSINVFAWSKRSRMPPVTAMPQCVKNLTLKPGEGIEVKLKMVKGAKVNFAWPVDGGAVNFDLHGDGGGQETSYEKGRSVPKAEGVLQAAFDGNHGWFWRNRGKGNVTLTLKTQGDYSDIKRLI